MSNPSVIEEFEARHEKERAKALRKYGPDALVPGGRPDYDVLDYTVGELVGLVRYGEMIEARHKQMLDLIEDLSPKQRVLLKHTVSLSRELSSFAARYAFDVIDVRQQLKKNGFYLGLTEEAS